MRTIERGLADSKEGRTKDVKEVRAKYGLGFAPCLPLNSLFCHI
jgi:hypothetical protein